MNENEPRTKKSSSYFLAALFLITFALLCAVFAPYLTVFILAVVFGVIFRPLNEFFLKYIKSPGLAALFSMIIVLLIILGPVALVITQILKEAQALSVLIQSKNFDSGAIVASIQARLQTYVPYLKLDLVSYIASALAWMVQNAVGIFSNVAAALINILLSMMGLYYWFKDGAALESLVVKLSPLPLPDSKKILAKLSDAVHSVIRGTITVIIIQGIQAGLAFYIFGVPNAILWGAFASISSLIPGLGTAPAMIPVIIYLFVSGHTLPAIGLLIWDLIAIGLIDNFLGPKLISRKTRVHPFLILISVLGGLQLFGPVGLFVGPLLASLFSALLDIYSQDSLI